MTAPTARAALAAIAARIGALVLAATIAACAQPRPATIPMQQLSDLSGCAAPSAALVVMLPGAYSQPQEFIDEGFVAALRQRSLAVDVKIVDAHLGYFTDRTVLQRLRADVVLPARAAGYRQVWLVGISLGGLAALGYAARHADEVDGVLAIAPYPGTLGLRREIADAGGPRAWHQAVSAPQADLEREIWWWLGMPPEARMPPVYLGYGSGDRFASGLAQMADTVPTGHTSTVPGGHDWAPWRALWNGWLERGLLEVRCGTPIRR